MKTSLYLLLVALLCCAIVALAQESSPIGEKPQDSSSHTPEGEKPSSSDDGIMCTAMYQAVTCPDGTTATRTNCLYICGSAPVGNLTYDQVEELAIQYYDFYEWNRNVTYTYVSTLADEGINVQSPESATDNCIAVSVYDLSHIGLPDVLNGARVVYVQYSPPDCAPMLCSDGTVVGCNDVCPDPTKESMTLFTPITIMLVVFVLSACCCCIRRRKCRAKCRMNNPVAPQPVHVPEGDAYPAAQYHQLLQQQDHETEIPMHPVMGQPIYPYPPMPMMPPQMHMMPNGAYPVMVQGPNGMWYPMTIQPPQEDM